MIGGSLSPRADLDSVMRRKTQPLPGTEPQLSSSSPSHSPHCTVHFSSIALYMVFLLHRDKPYGAWIQAWSANGLVCYSDEWISSAFCQFPFITCVQSLFILLYPVVAIPGVFCCFRIGNFPHCMLCMCSETFESIIIMMDKPVKCDSKYKTLPGAAQQQIMKL